VSWDYRDPTWRERPEAALLLIRAQLVSPGTSPRELAARSEERRNEATDRVLTRLPARKHDEFRRIVRELEGYVTVREDRAYWQMVLTGEVRLLALRIGDELVRTGRVERVDDVLFLTPDDYEDTVGDLRRLVAQRRGEWERWCAVVPPQTIGTSAGVMPTPAPPRAGEVRGAPASRGTVTGPARIVLDPEDGARLRRGDILVCVMTTPAWTPLFSIVGGVITETGGALSHPAITAREYGIPAVVAARDATSCIREGQTVTIDGAQGLVTLHE
jgi:pyruvate,water dikinase